MGTRHLPDSARYCELAPGALWATQGCPKRVPLASARVVEGRALSLPNRPSLGQAAGACCPLSLGTGPVGLRTCKVPHRASSCVLALRVFEAAQGCLEKGPSCIEESCPGSGTLPPPIFRPWGRRLGPAARFPLARGVCVWGPFTYPTAHGSAGWLCALCGRHKGVLLAGGLRLCEGCLGSGTLPPPAVRP